MRIHLTDQTDNECDARGSEIETTPKQGLKVSTNSCVHRLDATHYRTDESQKLHWTHCEPVLEIRLMIHCVVCVKPTHGLVAASLKPYILKVTGEKKSVPKELSTEKQATFVTCNFLIIYNDKETSQSFVHRFNLPNALGINTRMLCRRCDTWVAPKPTAFIWLFRLIVILIYIFAQVQSSSLKKPITMPSSFTGQVELALKSLASKGKGSCSLLYLHEPAMAKCVYE